MDITVHGTIHIPTLREALGYWKAVLLLAVLATTLVWPGGDVIAVGPGNSIESVAVVDGGHSMTLDAAGNPVLAFADPTSFNLDLEVLRCGDPNCTASSSTTPTKAGLAGTRTSIALDGNGYPVVSYKDFMNVLRILHCGSADCSTGNTVTAPVGASNGDYSSLQLDGSGYPVVAFYGSNLELLHCNDVNCDDANDPVNTVDPTAGSGQWASMALDTSGYPVISYWDSSGNDLKVAHCNDPTCDATVNGAESVVTVDSTDDVGQYTSLVLDGSGNPVVSYYDSTNGDLKLVKCGDANCSSGNTFTTVDGTGDVGLYTSLALDADGYPVISYMDRTAGFANASLKLVHCGDATCSANNVVLTADAASGAGFDSSLVLDSDGDPVVAYNTSSVTFELKVLHCVDPTCEGLKPVAIAMAATTEFVQPKMCYEVMDNTQAFLFSVCDNDFQGAPANHAACDDGNDTICNDEDPTEGSVVVTVDPAVYNVEVGKTPLNITADSSKAVCQDAPTCSLTFTNTTDVRPWFPWDVAGPGQSWPPDGVVDLPNDVLGVILNFCPVVTDPCAKP